MVMKGRWQTSPWHCWGIVAGLAVAVAGVVVLYFKDPAQGGFPICIFHKLTGLDCPGCGTQRALHQLFHGNFAAAWRFNALAIALLPMGVWLMARELIWLMSGKRLPGVVTRPSVGWTLLAVVIVFGVLRNVPKFQ